MRVLFSPAYQLERDPKQSSILEPFPPLGTLYAASYLRREGHEVRLCDTTLDSGLSAFSEELERFRPELLAIYEDNFNYLSKMCLTNMRELAWEKARRARARGVRVVVNGSDATDHLDAYLRVPVDFAILGEGERTLAELAAALERDTPPARLARIPGLAFLERETLVRTVPREFIKDLDRLPFPAWDLSDVERYRRAWHRRHDHFVLNMVTTRGCPYHCNWCAKPIYGQRYNVRSPASVAEEMAWVKGRFRPDRIWFADDIFGLKPGWVEAFAAEVEARDAALPFTIQARVDLVDEDVARALKRAGCRSVWVGAESGSQRILDAMEKGTTVQQIFDATRVLRSQGIEVGFFLQFGYPGEDLSDIRKTLAMVRRARPDDIGISVSYPLPGTKFYDRVQRELGAKTNWGHSDDLDLMFPGNYAPEFYKHLYDAAHREFRLRRDLGRLPSPLALARCVRNAVGLSSALLRLRRSRRRSACPR